MITDILEGISLNHRNEQGDILVMVTYFEELQEVVIVSENKELVDISYKNIPALIDMLQTVMGNIEK